jgi:LuxR family maltose regulon positive regulatory protein
VATAAIGHHSESRTLLVESLESGARQGLCMTFSDAGLAVRQLIAELAGPTPDASTLDLQPYIQALIRQFNRRNEACRNQRSGDSPPRALTQRETAILQLIARGLSNKHIARRYGITPETVKTHVKRIMLKLAAQTRAQAVARAETLGVL